MLDFVEEAGLTFLHVFPYSERPFTPAARMPQLPVPLRRERAARLREAGRRAARRFYEGRVGGVEQVVLERPDRGHAESFAPVRLRTPGQRRALCRVRVTGCDDEGLIGALILADRDGTAATDQPPSPAWAGEGGVRLGRAAPDTQDSRTLRNFDREAATWR
jgi:tRNA A37 methylthiotransferase MiaB